MIGRKRGPELDVGERARLQLFGERDAILPGGFAPGNTAREYRRMPGSRQELRGRLERARRGLRRVGRAKPLRVRKRRYRTDFRFLQAGVEVDVGRPAR